jgi:hypothetical protein
MGTKEKISKMSLTGRNIEEVIVYNALAITNTAAIYSAQLDLSQYRSIEIFLSSTLDQTVDFGPVIDNATTHGTSIWNGTAFVTMPVTTIPLSSGQPQKYLLASRYDFIQKSPPKWLKIYLRSPTTAPTTGSVTVKIWGVPN